MDNEAIHFQQPTGPRPPSLREILWDELELLHTQRALSPLTTTFMHIVDRAVFRVSH